MEPYVFLSHSQNDIEKVRQIRDELETGSFEPILFNLKCLTDADELSALVKREIEARRWFIYLDSAAARKSERVQAEVSYARDVLRKHIFRIDLDSGMLMQKLVLDMIMKKMRRADR